MYIVGIDPGLTTGYCVLEITKDEMLLVDAAREIVWEERMLLFPLLDRIFQSPAPVALVVETFTLYKHKAMQQIGSDFPSVRVIGTIEAITYVYGYPLEKIQWQSAAQIRDVKIQHALPSGSEHIKDAYKHARLLYVRWKHGKLSLDKFTIRDWQN